MKGYGVMKKDDNKGFSLIELIIVIAIMAVLVALIAPNLTKYLGSAKYNTDKHNADDLAQSIQTCILDYEVDNGRLIPLGGSDINLTWTAANVSGGPSQFNSMLDSMLDKEPKSKENGTMATAKISRKSSGEGYSVTVKIGNITINR